VKAAYRSVCKSCHPDSGGSAEEFRAVKAARDFLLSIG
jgi:hypothetical protein